MVTYDSTTAEINSTELNALGQRIGRSGCGDKALFVSARGIKADINSFLDDGDYPSSFIVQERAWLANAWSFDLSGTHLRVLQLGG